MPYITKQQKDTLFDNGFAAGSPGELNFTFTALAYDYFKRMGRDYNAANDVLGALEGAKLEFYRRVVAPYEDVKKEQNGDVYDPA